MNNKTILVGALLLILFLGIGLLYTLSKQESTFPVIATSSIPISTTTTPVKEPPQAATGTSDIVVDNLTPNQVTESPLTLTGKAHGYYFEGSFPVELKDANGKILFQGPAKAQSDWMTPEFVPFKVTLIFSNPTTSTGTISFKKDNPSGLPENDKVFIVPVQFKSEARPVTLYYYKPSLDKDASGNILCSAKGLVSVLRKIPESSTPLSDTMRLFLKGELTQADKNNGITTEYPLLGVELQKADINQNGLTTFALADPNHKTSGGACRVSVLKAQFEATAKQFPTVKNIQYTTPIFQP